MSIRLPQAAKEHFVSPSLLSSSEGAYELKLLLNEDQAQAVESIVRLHLPLDPFSDPLHGYRTTTLCCDTPAMDVLAGNGKLGRRKHRVRRYGDETAVYLERKVKAGARVRKRRTMISLDDIARLEQEADLGWAGDWFHAHLRKRVLRPVCVLTYQRRAFSGHVSEGPSRVTFDRMLRGRLGGGWDLTPVTEGEDALQGRVVVELKFNGALPQFGKRIMEELRLTPGPASKYKRFLAQAGVQSPRSQQDASTAS